ncbi:hypothetical protein Smp_169180 [Schistosoma mansoni]|uniref:hypothetical protein n=1 Tax=Schistosoma mansoni TaxID=6183 RepID=UPI00022DC0A4|nr:hypothetical protein Smp_169180 [Schistosoma mansoni]|eukprot:XP_018649274.1 hypothetical protein Smp_169180 [Schistosoma mansoni]
MEADPAIVLEWLDSVNDELRELQLTALEQLCNEVLFSDNVDVFFERYPPRLFIPALCKIFLDELAPDSVLEANARALTYYLDVSLDCAPRIARSPNVLTAMTSRLDAVDMTSAKSNELGQQIIKMLQLICTREPGAVYTAGGLTSVLRYIRLYPHLLHADVLQAGMDIIRRLFSRADPADKNLTSWIDALSSLLDRRETGVADQALRAFANLVARFTRTGADPSPLADSHIIDCLLQRLRVAGGVETDNEVTDSSGPSLPTDTSGSSRDGLSSVTTESNPVAVHAVTNILTSLCCNSVSITHKLLTSDGQFAMTLAMVVQRSTDELVVLSVLRLIEVLLVLLHQTQNVQLKSQNSQNTSQSEHTIETPLESQHSWEGDAVHRHFIEAIKRQDLDFMKRSLKSGKIDVNYMDHLGQTLLNWAASFGSPAMVELLCTHGANVNLGVRTPLDYAASFGRVEICKTLLNWGADINKQDVQGRKPIDRAREHPDFPGSQQVIDLLESESKRAGFRGLSSKLDKSDKQLTPGSSSTPSSYVSFAQHKPDVIQSNDPGEAQRLFVDQLLPLLVGLFKESTSSVRHQCTLLVWRMIQYMRPDHLETISLMDNQSVPFAFSLTQMIYTVLIEEREELISRALELSLRLLNKTPHIYVLVFYRLGLIPLIQIIIDILHHLLIMENKSGVTVTTITTSTTNTGQQFSVSSSDENEGKDVCTASVTKKTTDTTSTTTVMTSATSSTVPASITPTISPSTTTTTTTTTRSTKTKEIIEELSQKNTLVIDKENKSESVKNVEKQRVRDQLNVNLNESKNYMPEILSTPTNEDEEEQQHQLVLQSTSTSERVHLDAQLYNWNGWYFFCMGQLLSIFNGFAFITIQLQPEDGGLRVLCIHNSAHRNNPVPIQLHPGENPFSRPSLKSRMLRMHQHLMELIDSNITITPLFKDVDTETVQTTENDEGREQTNQLDSVKKQTQLNILTHSSLSNLEASHNNARRFRRRLGLRHDPISINLAATTMGGHTSKLQRQASSPARVCLTSRFSTRIPIQSNPTESSGLLDSTTSVSFGSIICSLLKRKDGTYVSVKPRAPTVFNSKSSLNEALLLSENFCSGFKRVRIASISKETPVSSVNTEFNNTASKTQTNPNVLLKSTKRHSRSFINSLNIGTAYLNLCDTTSFETTTESNITTDFTDDDNYNDGDRKFSKTDQSLTNATNMELSRIDKLFFPNEIIHETYNSGQLVVLLRTEEIKLIVMQIWDIFKMDKDYSFSVTLNKLFIVFKKLSDLLNEGEQTITAYELTTSGLIQVLLLCLSVAYAGHWHCHIFSMELDNTTALLWYLQERRRVFVLNMLSHSKSKSISLLVRRLVQAFELTEHLPLRLFSAAHLLRSSSTNASSVHHDTSNHKLDRNNTNNNMNDSNKTLKNTNTNYIPPTNLINRIGYSASLPINFINSSFSRCHSGIYTDHGDPVSINFKQPFQDSMDAKELAALLRFCPILLDYPEFDSCFTPSLHQIAKRLPLYLDKLSNLPSVVELKSNNNDNNTTENKLHHNKSKRLYNWRGKLLFVSPLATVGQLERFLSRMSTKQWYECSRLDLSLWSQIHLANSFNSTSGLYFPAPPPGNSSADYLGGIIDWLATNGNRRPLEDWINPAIVGLISIAASTSSPVKGRAVSILGPQAGALVGGYTIRGSGIGVVVKPKRMNCPNGSNQNESRGKKSMSDQKSSHTSFSTVNINENETHAWITVDLGLQLIPTAYTLAYLRRADASEHSLAPRNWKLEASNDAVTWIVLREHNNDLSIQSVSGSRATWSINSYHNNYNSNKAETISSTLNTACTKKSIRGWRFFKIQTTGTNANGGKQLALGGLEFYGNVYSVHDSVLTPSALAQKIYSISSERKDASPPPQTITKSMSSSSWLTVNVKLSTNNRNSQVDQNEMNNDANDINNCTVIKSDAEEITEENSSSKSSNLNITLKQIDNHRRDPKSSNDEIIRHHITSIISSDTLMNILFDEEAGSDDNMMTSASKSDVDMILELSAKKLDNLNILSSGTIDDKLLQCFGNLLANDKSSPELYQLLRRIAPQDLDYDLLNKCTSRSMDSIHSGEEEHHSKETMNNYQSEDTKRIDSIILDTGEIDITEPHISYIDHSNPEASGESDVPGLGYLLNSIEPEAIEFADTVEAIIRSNTVQNRRNNIGDDNENPIGLTINKISQTSSHSWKHFQSTQNANHKNNNRISVDQLIHNEEEKSEKICEPIGLLTQSSESYSNLPVIKTVNTEPCNNTNKLSKNSDDHNQQLNETYQYSEQLNETTSFNANLSSDSSGFQVLPSSWKPIHQQFRRRIRRNRPRQMVSSESKDTPASHSNSPHSGTPPVPLSWNEATDALRLPLGLIPTFIPNPGSTNAPGTTAYVLCRPPSSDHECSANDEDSYSRLSLFLGIYMNSEYLIQIPLRDKNATLFNYIQSTIRTIYGKALLNKHDLRFTPSLDRPIIYTSSGIKIPIISDNNIDDSNNNDVDGVSVNNLTNKSEYLIMNNYDVHKSYPPSDPEDILQLIKLLYQLSGLKEFSLENNNNNNNDNSLVGKSESIEMKMEDFTSTRLTNKLLCQIHDPLALASGALPNWCLSLSQRFNILFSFNVRSQLFSACAFGPARAATWLQNRPLQKRTYLSHSDGYSRAGSAGSASGHDRSTSQIGRLHKEFVRIPHNLTFWHWASRLMEEHASRKSELEIQFIGEEGTGLGPTLEFYSLLAAELRRRDGLMWVTNDFTMTTEQSSHSHSVLPTVSSSATIEQHVISNSGQPNSMDNEIDDIDEANIYVNTPYGLFPAPWPGDQVPESVLYRFFILGITVAKCLQDNRRIDLPLSSPLLKLLSTYGSVVNTHNCLLNLNDFCIIYPERAQFLKQITEFHRRKSTMSNGNTNEKCINDLAVEIFGCDLTDLCLSMEFLPSSKLFGFSSYPLKDVYDWEATITTTPRTTNNSTEESLHKNVTENSQSIVAPVTVHNIEKYLELTLAFCLDKGIRKQLDAFKDGFERVLPLRWLALFTATELGELIAGDSVVHWTREDLLAYTVPSLGFTKQSPTYQMLINVLCNFNSTERRAFLQFTTGCSSLPPGGLKNLHPRLRIVRKEITNSGPYPSVNTCVHYLKLPEYQSEKELRTRLLQATKEIGFYLN